MSSETETIEFERSSGNVFADLAIPNPTEELAKADLAIEITRRIRARGLTQTEAAALLGTAQSKISAIRRGHLTYFTYDRLLRFLNLLGCNVEIVVTSADDTQIRGQTVTSINAPYTG
jgi:predicted XRE-type DNA-binding protein